MKVTKAIVTAMKEEADIIIEKFQLKEVLKKWTLSIYEGENTSDGETEKIVLALAGIGKICATMATTYLFENYDIHKLINIGIAWNMWNIDIKMGDVFMPNTFIQHDMYLPFEGKHLDYAKKPIFLEYAVWQNLDLTKFGLIMNGLCITWDQFIDDEEKVADLKDRFEADICDMEAFAILSVAREYDALDKCVVIKAVSDWADSDAKDTHMNNLQFAMKNSVIVLEFVL